MRFTLALFLLLILTPLWCAEEELKLPPDVIQAQEKADKAAKDIKTEADAKLAKVNQDLLKALLKAQEAATRKGDLKLALALSAKAEKLQEATDLLAPPKAKPPLNPKTDLVGEWKYAMKTHAGILKIDEKGNCALKGSSGSLQITKKDTSILWNNGSTWAITERGGEWWAMDDVSESKLTR